MDSLRSINLKWTEYLKSEIRIPKSKICFWKFLFPDQTGFFGQRQRSCETKIILTVIIHRGARRATQRLF
ncbi:hypothetical protein D1AOALGA4SA_3571 [Olavius algarvensis Delta 1 endosymbiont]|nr:hypothetical protein D1AOALGA4SA_3571 [Olavius algarvensis Delta 1 endosymbiont]